MDKPLNIILWYLGLFFCLSLIISLWIYNYYYIDYSNSQEDYIPDYVTGQAMPN